MKVSIYLMLFLVTGLITPAANAAFGESAKRRVNQDDENAQPAAMQQQIPETEDDEFTLPELSTEDGVDSKEKRKRAVELVQRGINYAMDHSLDESLSSFTHNKQFKHGELYLFVFGLTGSWRGVCLAHGQEPQIIWQNLLEKRDNYGIPLVQKMINRAEKGGGWVTYQWRNSTKTSYVKTFTKGN